MLILCEKDEILRNEFYVDMGRWVWRNTVSCTIPIALKYSPVNKWETQNIIVLGFRVGAFMVWWINKINSKIIKQ
jgi:hypothetical protein